MISKGEETKEKILKQAAELFNQQGYASSSISEIMRVTGLQKGGIYNHFKSKEELALEAFDYAIACVSQRYRDVLRSKCHAVECLQALLDVFSGYVDNPPIAGGCPLLNTAIESDDAHPALRERAQQAMNSWRNIFCQILEKGIEKAEIRPDVDADEAATILISSIEGAVMMSKLYGDSIYMKRVINHLTDYIESQLRM